MKVPFLELKRQYEALSEEMEAAVLEVMRSVSYIGGEYVQRFEAAAADYLGVTHVAGCANGTDALVLALRACNVRAGDEVITSPFTFFATAEAIASIGAVPVFVDIDAHDFTIDVNLIEEKITAKTKVILPVHIFGVPCDMDSINALARKHGLKVVEDAAQAIGSRYKGRKTGGLGDIGCFSFYPTKNLGACGDGGMLSTNSEEYSTILRALREHGAAQNGAKARELLDGIQEDCQTKEVGTALYNPYKYYNYLIGYNSRLDAIQAAILSIKLKYLDQYNQSRARIATLYSEGLCQEVQLPVHSAMVESCWHQYVILTPQKHELCAYLQNHGIGAGTFYPIPLHEQKAFAYLGYRTGDMPVAERIAAQSVCLPIFPELKDAEITYVIQTVNQFFSA